MPIVYDGHRWKGSSEAEAMDAMVNDTAVKQDPPTTWLSKHRQFRWFVFDVTFGIVVPVVCLVFDLGVFRSITWSGDRFLGEIQIFAYLAPPVGIAGLSMWLKYGVRMTIWSGFVAAVLFTGVLFAFYIGIQFVLTILNFSTYETTVRFIIAEPKELLRSRLMFEGFLKSLVCAVLGSISFLASGVYLRNAVQAYKSAKQHPHRAGVIRTFLLGLLLSFVIPAVVNWKAGEYVSESIQQIITGDAEVVEAGIERLQNVFWCELDCYIGLESAYENTQDEARREVLADAYREITGRDIQWRTMRWLDD
jgi:hypothetical protein